MNDAVNMQILDDIDKLSNIKPARLFCQQIIFY